MTRPTPLEVSTSVSLTPRRVNVTPQRTGIPGPAGPTGPQGPAGPAGQTGAEGPIRRVQRFHGSGPPPDSLIGAAPGDEYLDTDSGTLYILE